MDVWARVIGIQAKTSSAVWSYFQDHLLSARERPDDRPGWKPWIFNVPLWDVLGLTPAGFDEELIRCLLAGRDLQGNKLTASRTDFRRPTEFLLALPCEVSHGLALLGPTAMDQVLLEVAQVAVTCIEAAAVRVMEKGVPLWAKATCPIVVCPHHTNAVGDPHGHAHIGIFPPALMESGTWKTYDPGALVRSLSKGTRPMITAAMIKACGELGMQVVMHPGLSRDEGRYPPGAEVTLPSGLVVPAGSLPRYRSAEIRADRELRVYLGGPALTARELAWVAASPGVHAAEMPKPANRATFVAKLGNLGLLGAEGCLLEEADLKASLLNVSRKMAQAQVDLEAFRFLPGDRLGAARLVAQKRTAICHEIGVDPEPDRQVAADDWVCHAAEALTAASVHLVRQEPTLPPFPIPAARRLFYRHAQRAGLIHLPEDRYANPCGRPGRRDGWGKGLSLAHPW